MLRSAGRIDIVHVPYKGDVQLTPALLANEVQLAFLPSGAALPMIKASKLRALAVTGRARSRAMPELPTMAESGLPDFEYNGWTSFFVPSGTPPEIIKRIGAEGTKITRSPELAKYYAAWGAEPPNTSPEELPARYRAEMEKYAKLVREARIPLVD
jgi:tripartite-type tricarboxylate transporter receptor subunit TctC